MNELRLVLDTNIFISGLLSKKSLPFQIIKFAFDYHTLLASDETLAEIKKF